MFLTSASWTLDGLHLNICRQQHWELLSVLSSVKRFSSFPMRHCRCSQRSIGPLHPVCFAAFDPAYTMAWSQGGCVSCPLVPVVQRLSLQVTWTVLPGHNAWSGPFRPPGSSSCCYVVWFSVCNSVICCSNIPKTSHALTQPSLIITTLSASLF